jgi:signal transduction histidine kinase
MEKLVNEPFYLLPPLVTFVVNLILVLIVLRETRRSATKWLFCTLLFSLGLWGLFLFYMRISPDVHHALPWDKAVAVTFYFSFVLYYHFTLAFTRNSGQRRILLVAYLLLLLFIALAPTNLIIERMYVASYGYAPVIGPLTIPLSLGSIFLMISGSYNLIRRYIVSPSQEERNHLVYLVFATVFPLTGALLDAFSDFPPMGLWGVLAFCFISTVSIIRYHLLDIRIVVRKGLAFLLVSAAIAVPYVGVIFMISGFFRQTTVLWWIQPIFVLLLAIMLRPFYSRVQQFVDRVFYRDRYNYLRALEQFSRETQSVTNLEKLASTVVELVKGALRVLRVYLLVFSEHRYGFIEISPTSSNNLPSGVILRGNSPLARWLEHNKEVLSSDQLDILPQLQSFSLRERNCLQLMGTDLYVPIITREGRLSGILALSKKLSEQSYSEEDKQILSAVCNQMAMALENARLYETSQREVVERKWAEQELRRSHEQLRDLSAHLQLAREEERTSIAREIHDDLGQALTALKMDVSWLGKKLPQSAESLRCKIQSTLELIDETIKLVKKISVKLRPSILDDLGLGAAIEWQAQELQNRTRIKFEVDQQNADHALDLVDRERATAVFRILQESLTNVARHAKATKAKISLREDDNKLILEVVDNGIGITNEQITNPKSFGLMGMKERALSHNGELKINGVQGKGTTVMMIIRLD